MRGKLLDLVHSIVACPGEIQGAGGQYELCGDVARKSAEKTAGKVRIDYAKTHRGCRGPALVSSAAKCENLRSCCCNAAVSTTCVQQAAHSALEELCRAVRAELDEARSTMSSHSANRQALLRRTEAAQEAIDKLKDLNRMSTQPLPLSGSMGGRYRHDVLRLVLHRSRVDEGNGGCAKPPVHMHAQPSVQEPCRNLVSWDKPSLRTV